MAKSKIQWTNETWNPVRGCSRSSPGCDNCYAMGQAHRFNGPGQPFEGLTTIRNGKVDWKGVTRFVPELLDRPLRWKRPRRVFVNSMSDLFHPSFTNEEIAAVFGVMAAAPAHTFQVLTKHAERMREWFAWVGNAGWAERRCHSEAAKRDVRGLQKPLDCTWPLPNVHLGVSCEDQQRADERIPHLLATPAAVRFVSAEPLIGPINFRDHDWTVKDYLRGVETCQNSSRPLPAKLDWVIVGGESGPHARPCDVAWIRSVVTQCREAGTPCFVKQLGSNVFAPWRVEWRSRGSGGFEAYVEGRPKASFATVWPNGTWHTWDADGTGGANDTEPTVEQAQAAALRALETQHVHPVKGWRRHAHMLRARAGSDPAEWPEDLRVREFPQ